MSPKISVIVTVYNVSQFIEKCAHTLFNQTFKNVEYIFVNDASTDDSVSKLENVIAQYPNIEHFITIVHNPNNCGPAISRNNALDLAQGDYVLMVDSDDYLEFDMIDSMYNEALKSNADIVVCDMIIEFQKKSIISEDYVPDNNSDYFSAMLTTANSSPSLCNKLIKKDLYLNPQSRNINSAKYMEDRFVCARLYFFANNIAKVNQVYYHYIKHNPNSNTFKINASHFESLIYFWQNMDVFLFENNITDKYKQLVNITKVKDKLKLMFSVDSYKIRKSYSELFYLEENEIFNQLKLGERTMLFLLRKKMYIFTSLLRNLMKLKTNLLNN